MQIHISQTLSETLAVNIEPTIRELLSNKFKRDVQFRMYADVLNDSTMIDIELTDEEAVFEKLSDQLSQDIVLAFNRYFENIKRRNFNKQIEEKIQRDLIKTINSMHQTSNETYEDIKKKYHLSWSSLKKNILK